MYIIILSKPLAIFHDDLQWITFFVCDLQVE